jgi:CheY-like chemotaxis protein
MAVILVIDDEETILNVVEAYLKAEGNTVHLARDGQQGLAAFRRYQPELVILDIMRHVVHKIGENSKGCQMTPLLAYFITLLFLRWL